jgi:protein SCO1/2
MPNNRQTIVFFVLVLLLLAGIALYQWMMPPQIHGSIIDPPKPMPDFTLQSARGPVSLSDFRGKIVVLYFGYTSCPDVCPTTLASLRQALTDLGDRADQVQVIMVSVDWKRDTPASLASYLGAFRPDYLGLTGDEAQINAVTKAFGIYYKLNEPDASGYYSVEHTATLLVLDRQGQLVLTWPYGQAPDEIASDLGVLVKK